jgi:O-antigen/teichoic acid export membrane protein
MSSLKEKSIYGMFWDLAGKLSLQGVGFIVSIVLARILAPEQFGLLAIVTVFISLASVFTDFGFNIALIQKQDVKDEHYSAVLYLNMTMGFLLATIVFLLAPLIGRFYNAKVLIEITRFMAFGIFISSFGHVMRARLRREMNFIAISLSNVLAALISGSIALYMAFKGFGIWSLAVQSVTNQFIANVLLFIFCRLRLSLKFSLQALQELWPFSSRLFISGLLDTIFFNFDSLIIGKLLSPTTLGYYQRAKSLESFGFRYTASIFSSVLLPGLSSIQNDQEKFKQTILKIFHLLSFISFLGCGLILVGGRELIIILFSAKWEPSVVMFQILISGAFAQYGISLFNDTLLSSGNSKRYLFNNVISRSLLFLNFGILFWLGLETYLIGFVLVQLFMYYFGMWVVSRQLEFENQLFKLSLKQVSVFISCISIVFCLKSYLKIPSLIISLLFSICLFSILFLFLSKLLNKTGLQVTYSEFSFLINKVLRRA